MSKVLQRALTLFIATPFLLAALHYGGIVFFLMVAIGGIVGCLEYQNLMKQLHYHFPLFLLLLGTVGQWIAAAFNQPTYQSMVLFGTFFLSTMYYLWGYEKRKISKPVESLFSLMLGVLLLGWSYSHLFWLRTNDPLQGVWTGLVLLSIWGADVFAYGVGRFVAGRFGLGRHALTPHLSPRKTVEGYMGGMIFGTLLVIGIGVGRYDLPWIQVSTLGLTLTTFCIIGDLGISLLKREAQVKDSGRFLPGHGGALDRIDTLLWGVPLGYYLLVILQIYH